MADDLSEAELRRREVEAAEMSAAAERDAAKGANRGTVVQAIATVLAAAATLVAIGGLVYTSRQLDVAQQGLRQQAVDQYRASLDDRLAVAVDAVGRNDAAGRVAGITLLQRNAFARIELAHESLDERVVDDAVGTFGLVLDVMENYLRDPDLTPQSATFGVGWGVPGAVRPERSYVTDRLRSTLEALRDITNLAPAEERRPAIDLSGAQLYGTNWKDVDVSLLRGRAFSGVDLRGALLRGADFSAADMSDAHLQCANLAGDPNDRTYRAVLAKVNLRGASLRGADLSFSDLSESDLPGADLRDANLFGADLSGAELRGTRFEGAYGTESVVGPRLGPGKPGTFTLVGCRGNRAYDSPR